jgi:hypothetical protein
MGIVSLIEIEFWKSEPPSGYLAALSSANWALSKDSIIYEHYTDEMDIGAADHTESVGDEKAFYLEADRLTAKGETVIVTLWLGGSEVDARFFLSRSRVQAAFYGTRPRLKACPRYTDFTWLFDRIVCPIRSAGLQLKMVRCEDTE